MDKSRFQIFKAVISAYSYVWREGRYLAGLGLLPASLSFLTAVFTQSMRPDASLIEDFMWTLPATALFGWLMFQQTRLMLFGERIDSLPKDAVFVFERQQAMRASIIIWLLFNMASMGVALYLFWASTPAVSASNPTYSVIGMVLVGGLFWGVRFSVAHILTAAGYPLRTFVYRVNGIMISLRLIGLGFLTVLPIAFVLRGIFGLLSPMLGDLAAGGTITGGRFMLIALISAFASLAMTLVLNAAAIFALKEMLGRDAGRKGGISV